MPPSETHPSGERSEEDLGPLKLRSLHWVVLATSVVLTIAVWLFTSEQAERSLQERFERAAAHSVELVRDQMEKYEGSLWGGVGMIQSRSSQRDLGRVDWIRYYQGVDIINRYPGIKGIGVIQHVRADEIEEYVASNASQYPELEGFGIHPEVSAEDHFPITFIEPFGPNRQAVGLDMAFEENRLDGALRAMRSGRAQITGPITLVQDAEKAPGFLFFAPFYSEIGSDRSLASFEGMVYAPFVVKDLMGGALDRKNRHVSLRITDDDTILYDEHRASEEEDRERTSRYRAQIPVELYGRVWTFDIRGTQAFISAGATTTPLLILAGGIVINLLMLAVFVILTRSGQRARRQADRMTAAVRRTLTQLESSNHELTARNQDLEQFTYIASHDLQAPLRTIANYASLMEEDLADRLTVSEMGSVRAIRESASRMRSLLLAVLEYARAAKKEELEKVACDEVLAETLRNLGDEIRRTGAQVRASKLPVVQGNRTGLAILFRNLVANGLKFRREGVPPAIDIAAERVGDRWSIRVRDNGIGIDPRYRDKIFEIFQRLHSGEERPGTGIGLSSCKRIVESHGGEINVEPNREGGSDFVFTLAA